MPLLSPVLPEAVRANRTKTLDAPSFLVPYGGPEQADHSPNESFAVERLHQGIRTSAALLAELATTREQGD